MTEPKPSTSSTPYSSISSSSFVDLKAELGKKQADLSQHTSSHILGKRASTAKPSLFAKRNKGTSSRAARDLVEDLSTSSSSNDPDRARKRLEEKAKVYEKLKRGKTAGLRDEQVDQLLVDFDDEDGASESGSDVDESATVPDRISQADPLVEYTDEFGRTRLVPRSEVPRGVAGYADAPAPTPEYDPNVHYGDQRSFPVYVPPPSLLAARTAALAESGPLVDHYDGTRENRQKGAGFYNFSKDEEERARVMESLKAERERTERERERKGAKEDEREREREERKKMVEKKRAELLERRKKRDGGKGEGE